MSIQRNKRDEFDEPHFMQAVSGVFESIEHNQHVRRAKKPFILMFSAITLIVFAAVLWYSYPREHNVQQELAIPIIRADNEPVKILAENRGGMDIPHRDSTVFSALSGSKDLKIENLLDDRETPISRQDMFKNVKVTENNQNSASDQTAEIVLPANEDSNTQTKIVIEDVNTEDIKVTQLETQQDANENQGNTKNITDNAIDTINPNYTFAADHIPTPNAKPSQYKSISSNTEHDQIAAVLNGFTPSSGNAQRTVIDSSQERFFVQLGSLKSREGAEKAWDSMIRRFPSELTSLSLNIEEAYLADRGTYYRVQGGPVDEKKARSICTQIIKQRPGGCLVVKK